MNETLYRKIFKEVSFGYAFIEIVSNNNGFPADYRILDVNSVFESITGFKKSELIGKILSTVDSKKETSGFDLISFTEKIKLQDGCEEFEHYAEPSKKWYKVQVQIPENGYLLILFHDITETKIADLKIRESESRFRGIFESTPVISVQGYNCNREVIYWNQASEILYGYSRDEAIGRKLEELIIPREMHADIIRLINLWINEGIPIPASEFTLRRADGSKVPVFSSHVLLNNSKGEMELFSIDIDLSQQKKVEKALARNEANLTAIIENTFESIWSIDTNYEIQYVNEVFAKAFLHSFGVQLDKGVNLLEALPDNLKPVWKERYDRAFNNEHFIFEDKIAVRDSHIYIEVAMNPIVVDGKVVAASFFGRDVTDKKLAEEKLIKAKENIEDSEEKLRFLFDNMTQGVVYHSSTGEVIYANKAASRILGLSLDQLFGKTSLDPRWRSIREDGSNYPGELHPAMITLKTGKEVRNEIMGVFNPDKNSYSWININSIPKNKPGQKDPYQVVVTFEDITEIRNARERAEESNRLKTAFLQNMSHEIRTPMNAILGFLELLKEPDLTGEEKNSYIEIVNQSGERLLYTINDIIEISKIESGQSELLYSEVNISDVMQYHHSLFLPKSKAKGLILKLSKHILYDDLLIKTDRHKLEGILTNLINNAIKFTNQGSIEFGNYLADDSLVFFVKDTGIGIPDNRFDAVFNRFVQADLNNTRPYEGSGLGLAIAKAYAEMLGGNIWVESEVGKGSTFFFSIPYAQMNHIDYPENQQVTESLKKGVCILIAEDDEFSFQYLQSILKVGNVRILRSTNGDDTLKYVENNPEITIVLMDIKMPGMDGLEATKRIRQFNKEIPIIAQTAYALAGDREKTIEAGCNDYISKPVNRAELIRLVNKYSTHAITK